MCGARRGVQKSLGGTPYNVIKMRKRAVHARLRDCAGEWKVNRCGWQFGNLCNKGIECEEAEDAIAPVSEGGAKPLAGVGIIVSLPGAYTGPTTGSTGVAGGVSGLGSGVLMNGAPGTPGGSYGPPTQPEGLAQGPWQPI